jgi:polyisoprenoid-binding protein YceI
MTNSDWIGDWQLDPQRTTIEFHSPTFWGLAHVKGTFGGVTGSGRVAAADDGIDVTGRLDIDAASLKTGIAKRDKHLRSPDFFDVQAFPSIAVVVHSGEVTGTGWVLLQATLSVKDTQRDLELPTHVRSAGDGALRLQTTTTLNRLHYGVDGNLLGMMGEAVNIEATAVFVRQS